MRTFRHFNPFAWLLTTVVVVMAFISWGQGFSWQFGRLSVYSVFPIFGLVAFSLIWSMYVVSFFKRHYKSEGSLDLYFKVVPIIVFAAILIHPGLLWWQLWRDGFGLPPESYLQHYVAPSLKWAALIGSTAWFVFIVYEFRYKFRDRSWWKFVEYAADVVFVGLFFHALALGQQIHHVGWFRYVWFFYGFVLAVVIADLYLMKFSKNQSSKKSVPSNS